MRSLGRLSGRRLCQLNSCNSAREWKYAGGESAWDRLCLHQLWSHPACSTPTPTAPPAHLQGPVIALIPVAPASDVSFGQADKSRPEELGSSGGEACLMVCSWPEGSQTSVSSCSRAKAENLGRQACSKRLQRWGLMTFLFIFFFWPSSKAYRISGPQPGIEPAL